MSLSIRMCPYAHDSTSLRYGQQPLEASGSRAQVAGSTLPRQRKERTSSCAMTLSKVTDCTDKDLVVKAKVTQVIMNTLITKQTQENI
ncbi:putative monooxygenase p33MONOX [Sciurus carolinensis]|uniref:Monooxygenase p33MONOX n=1 Tax=Sciurus carolinensis TaxID=30640 RepID=A0AA41NJH0_SCICA|nr:putative monooxygenase p33MONOX [Sciurus carolinensis]